MNTYFFYLVYVGAVAVFSILLLRREYHRPNRPEPPKVLEVALLRGGLGAVVETVMFDLQARKLIELKVDSRSKRIVASMSRENVLALSKQEEAVLEAFDNLQGNAAAVKKARQQMTASVRGIMTDIQIAGWWRRPARWQWGLTILSPALIVIGSLRFIDSYEGGLQVALALTVPVFAVLVRRLVVREMTGPTARGQVVLKRLRVEKSGESNPLRQVALHGTQQLNELPEHRLFCFMMQGIPYGKL